MKKNLLLFCVNAISLSACSFGNFNFGDFKPGNSFSSTSETQSESQTDEKSFISFMKETRNYSVSLRNTTGPHEWYTDYIQDGDAYYLRSFTEQTNQVVEYRITYYTKNNNHYVYVETTLDGVVETFTYEKGSENDGGYMYFGGYIIEQGLLLIEGFSWYSPLCNAVLNDELLEDANGPYYYEADSNNKVYYEFDNDHIILKHGLNGDIYEADIHSVGQTVLDFKHHF